MRVHPTSLGLVIKACICIPQKSRRRNHQGQTKRIHHEYGILTFHRLAQAVDFTKEVSLCIGGP
jgi:hypothetical protein